MLIGSLVELHVGLHSCVCFSHLEKMVLKAGSTPPRYLLDTLLSVELLQLFLIAFPTASQYLVDRSRKFLPLDSFSTPGGSIKLPFLHLMDCSSTPPRYLYLSTTISSIHTSIASSIPASIEIYWGSIIFVLRDPILISSISFDLSALVHLPNTIFLTPNLFLYDFSSFFKIFFSW